MQDYSDSVMVALLPVGASWSKMDIPHLTLVYAGKVEDYPEHSVNELAKLGMNVSAMCSVVVVETKGTTIFGEGTEDSPLVRVLLVERVAELLAMRNIFESWNVSKHSFKPHVTLGPPDETSDALPDKVIFDRLLVSWGKQDFVFNLCKI